MKLARNYSLQLATDVAPHWCPSSPEFSHSASGFFATLPFVEPYLIYNMREAEKVVNDPRFSLSVQQFVEQEARHAQEHRRYNEHLKRRYPGLSEFEQRMRARFERSKAEHSLAFRMAYTAGFEALTYHLVCYIISERQRWLRDADPSVLGLLVWHGVEEVEHKAAAFDLYQALHGGYWLRARGLFAALATSVRDLRQMATYMLEVDGLTHDPLSQRRLRALRRALAAALLPRFAHYLRPNYHPSQYQDPPEIAGWLARDRQGEDQRRFRPSMFDRLLPADAG